MLKRRGVNRSKSRKKFTKKVKRTKVMNMRDKPQRGGWRLQAVPCYHPIDGFKPLDGGKLIFSRHLARNHVPVTISCGQCIGCRLERSRQWAVRCVHEAQMFSRNSFITLTYNDDYLPADGSLCYSDFQNFMKRMRFSHAGFDTISVNDSLTRPIRFYMAGEYGTDFGRPHFHACVFNFDFDDKYVFFKTPAGSLIYRSPSLERLWPYGFSSIGDVNFSSAAYVARYIVSKVTGESAALHYANVDLSTGELVSSRVPEFNKMSLKPGIGRLWFDQYHSDVYPSDEVIINGRRCKPPRYYDKLYSNVAPYDYDMLLFDRDTRARDNSDNMTRERLAVREQVAYSRLASNPRKLQVFAVRNIV